jgi:hypothetical protein
MKAHKRNYYNHLQFRVKLTEIWKCKAGFFPEQLKAWDHAEEKSNQYKKFNIPYTFKSQHNTT